MRMERNDTPENLIALCKKGKSRAQRELFKMYSPLFLNICMHYFDNRNDAEDAMVRGFYNIFRKIETYRGEGPFEAWMRRVVVNTAIDLYRKNHRNGFFTDLSGLEEESGPVIMPATNLENKDLLKLIHQMPAGYRMVFLLHTIEGFSHAEIAGKLGMTESTSRTQLLKGRKWLQQALGAHETKESNIYG